MFLRSIILLLHHLLLLGNARAGVGRHFPGAMGRRLTGGAKSLAASTEGSSQSLSSSDIKDLNYVESLTKQSDSELERDGWKAIIPSSSGEFFRAFQRPDKHNSSQAQFLVIAVMKDVSPRAALFANVNSEQRKRWDMGVKDIYSLPLPDVTSTTLQRPRNEDRTLGGACRVGFEEVLYYRSKCPWPMKDRDYVMARRCRVDESRGAALVVSTATEDKRVGPTPSGVNRIDSYNSVAAFLSTSGGSPAGSPMDEKGVCYVSLSTEEQVNASPSVMRILNKVAGKMVSDYMNKMATVVRDVEETTRSK